MPRRTPVDTDIHVGRRIYIRRRMLKLSQATLGKIIGVSFQQIQKYEKGENRVGGHRLLSIAEALKVPVSFFFDDAPEGGRDHLDLGANFVDEFLADWRGIELARYFVKMTYTERAAVLALVSILTKRLLAAEVNTKR